MTTLYICAISEDECVYHDGYMQMGIMSHSVEKHIELNPTINWVEVHWIPDTFTNRYKRVSFQKTERCNEGSPKTDNHS